VRRRIRLVVHLPAAATSFASRSCRELQREGITEDSHARQPAGKGANEVQRVDLDVFAVDAPGEAPASGAIEHELNGLTVDVGPLGHDVGDKAAVVIGRELHRALDGRVDIDPVSPDIAREPDVQEVFEGRPSDRRREAKRYVAGRRRVRHRPLTAFGPTAATCVTISSFERWLRLRIWNSFMPSTQWCESISLLSGMPRLNW